MLLIVNKSKNVNLGRKFMEMSIVICCYVVLKEKKDKLKNEQTDNTKI